MSRIAPPLLAIAVATLAAPATANPDTIPVVCGRQPPSALPTATGTAPGGTYRCSAEGITVTLRLLPGGRFETEVASEEAMFPPEESGDPKRLRRTGRWRVEADRLHLFQQPVQVPSIELIAQRHDPALWMRIEIRQPDGRPAEGLFVGEGEDANPRSALEHGVVEVPNSYGWRPGPRHIVRAGDDRRLATLTPTDTANSFRYVYRPSEVEPFDEEGRILDARGDSVMLPFGITGVLLRRVAAD